ncbi:MAG: BON domain-containing protein [Planctomycetota bacterium]
MRAKTRFAITARMLIPLLMLMIGGASVAQPNDGSQEAARDGGRKLDDHRITEAIDSQLAHEPAIPAHRIDITTIDGIVNLSGTVSNLAARRDARDIAESTKGVLAVINRITVDPGKTVDDEAPVDDVKTALLVDPATESFEVDVKADEGAITLRGTVDSWAERRLAGDVTRSIAGVTSIDNLVQVEQPETRSDAEIAPEIRGRLREDASIDDSDVEVTVDEGTVTLTGTVGSAFEKRAATYKAWVAGVDTVVNENLTVEWWAKDPQQRRSGFTSADDSKIEKVVERAMLYDPRVESFEIGVSADSGRVTLTGRVDNLAAKSTAEDLAQSCIGVWHVRNLIKVRPEDYPTDETLEQRAREAIERDGFLESYEMDVRASDGTLILSGVVDSQFEKDRAQTVMSRVQGIEEIRNRLDIAADWTWKSDAAIEMDVRDELFWSPFVDQDAIEVKVDNGEVTLRGQVEDWSEVSDAIENAYEGGARVVISHLDVESGADG